MNVSEIKVGQKVTVLEWVPRRIESQNRYSFLGGPSVETVPDYNGVGEIMEVLAVDAPFVALKRSFGSWTVDTRRCTLRSVSKDLVAAMEDPRRHSILAPLTAGEAKGPIMTHEQVDSFTGARSAKAKTLADQCHDKLVYTNDPAGFLRYVQAHPGCRGEEIRKVLGASRNEMAQMRKILGRKLKIKGQKRATTYEAR